MGGMARCREGPSTLSPRDFEDLLDCELASHNFRWIDLEYAGMGRIIDPTKFINLKFKPVVLNGGGHVT
jgi:hypothetical protein